MSIKGWEVVYSGAGGRIAIDHIPEDQRSFVWEKKRLYLSQGKWWVQLDPKSARDLAKALRKFAKEVEQTNKK